MNEDEAIEFMDEVARNEPALSWAIETFGTMCEQTATEIDKFVAAQTWRYYGEDSL